MILCENVCEGTNITFTASPTDAGVSPILVWKVNGTEKQSSVSLTYSSSTLSNTDVVEVSLKTDGTVKSEVTMVVKLAPVKPIIAPQYGDVCVGDIYSLSTATATNQISVLWTTTGDGMFSNISATSLNPDYTPGPLDIIAGSVDLTLTVTGNSPCLSIPNTMTLTVIPNPTPGPIFHN